MDKLKQIQEKIAEIQAKSAVAPELKAFATLFLKVLAEAKSDFSNISKENQAKIDQAFSYLEQEHAKLQDNVSQVTDSAKKDFENSLNEIKDLIKKIQTIKPIDGVDGYTPVKGEDYFTDSDIKEIKDEVLKDIPTVEEETGESIVQKINDLPIDNEDLKIDAKHVKNLPEQVRYYAGNSGIKEIIAGTNITVDNSNLGYPVISSTGVGGGTPGGSDTQLQYNNAGSFGGISGATTNGTSVTFTTGNLLSTDIKASGSGGLQILSNAGTVTALFGAGGGANSTFYGGSKFDYATATTVPYLDASKNLVSSAITPTELGYLSGVTSSIQTQLNAKGSGTVTSVTSADANATVATTTTTPVITIVSAPKLQNARTIGGVSFDGTANITVASATGGFAISGGDTTIADGNGIVIGNTSQLAVGGITSETEIQGTSTTDASLSLSMFNATAGTAAKLMFYRSKNASIGSATVVASGDNLGDITWYGAQQTGTYATQNPAAQIRAVVDGTVTSGAGGDMPGRIVFATTPDASGTLTDRLILDSAGVLKPNANDGVALGTTALSFSDLFLASGAVINFNNSNLTLTHSAGVLTLAGGILALPSSGFSINGTTVTSTGTQLNYLNAATGTTGTTSTNVVFSGSPTLATPTFTTSATVPLIIGGTGTTGTQLTFKTTTGIGTTDQMVFVGGNNGATTFATLKANSLDLGTSAALTTGTIELGATSDTTLSRVSAGVVAIEGSQITTLNTVSYSGNQTQTLSVKTRYLLSVGLYETQNMTLPSTFAVGDEIEFIINSTSNAGTVNIILAAGDNFLYVGTDGQTTSTTSDFVCSRNSSFKIVCTVANSTWEIVSIYGSGGSFGGTNISSIGYSIPLSAGDIMFTTAFQTVTNKRIQPRVSSSANGNITPNLDTANYYIRTALSGTCSLGVPTGSPTTGEELLFRFKDNGTARTLSWDAIYRAVGVTIPTTTVISKTLYVRAIYNSTDTKWDVVQVNQEA